MIPEAVIVEKVARACLREILFADDTVRGPLHSQVLPLKLRLKGITMESALFKRIGILALMICLAGNASADEFLVTNLADAGEGSLRAAVASANANFGPDVICFRRDLRGTIKLTSGQIEITDQLEIAGPGATRLCVSGDNASRIFRVGLAVEVSIEKLTIADGRNTIQENVPIRVTRGGAILNDGGVLSLFRVMMRNNVTIDEVDSQVVGGGAIVNSQFAMLTATNCTFIDNIARGGTRYAFGGAIGSVTESVAVVEDCTFIGNMAISGATSYGGAIGNFGGSELTVSDCQFFENTARGIDSGEMAFGGAIATRPGTVDNSGSLTVIDDSVLLSNLALGADGGSGQSGGDAGGGAIYNTDSVTVAESSIFMENAAEGGDGDLGGGNVYGGAMYAADNVENTSELLQIDRCLFRKNIALGGSPGSEVAGQALGGAIHNASSSLMDLRRSRVSRNLAIGGLDGYGIGGGLYAAAPVTADRRTFRRIKKNMASTSDDNVSGVVIVD